MCSDCEAYRIKKHGLTRSECIRIRFKYISLNISPRLWVGGWVGGGLVEVLCQCGGSEGWRREEAVRKQPRSRPRLKRSPRSVQVNSQRGNSGGGGGDMCDGARGGGGTDVAGIDVPHSPSIGYTCRLQVTRADRYYNTILTII